MSYTPPRELLRGMSLQHAELYGKPHIGAEYMGEGVKSHRAWQGAVCAVCGRPATNVHHVSPLSRGKTFRLETQVGVWELKPALFALCGTGTTGCHNGFHGGARLKAEWVWDNDRDAEEWWRGELLLRMRPHDPMLYLYGWWEITDLKTGAVRQVRNIA